MTIRPKLTASFVRGMVTKGKPGTLMPQFGGRLSSVQIDGLAQYVASLQQRPDDYLDRNDTVKGDFTGPKAASMVLRGPSPRSLGSARGARERAGAPGSRLRPTSPASAGSARPGWPPA